MAAIKVTVLKIYRPTKVENVGHVHIPFRSLIGDEQSTNVKQGLN